MKVRLIFLFPLFLQFAARLVSGQTKHSQFTNNLVGKWSAVDSGNYPAEIKRETGVLRLTETSADAANQPSRAESRTYPDGRMQKAFACALCVALFALTFYAQNQTPTEYNKNEFFAGYSESSMLDSSRAESLDFTGNKSFRGWSASYTYNFRRFVGVKTEVSGYYKNFRFDNLPLPAPVNVKSRIYNFLGGVQFKDNKKNKRFSPFVYALGGVSQTRTNIRSILCDADCDESNTGFSLAVGGGVDLKVRKRFSIRLIQIDYNPAFYNGFREQRLRAGFGIVIN